MNEIQIKIKKLVEDYKKIFSDEYRATIQYISKKRLNTKKFADVKGSDMIERLLYEIPETLQTIFDSRLTKSEKDWFQSKEGARWFASLYKEFVVAEKL